MAFVLQAQCVIQSFHSKKEKKKKVHSQIPHSDSLEKISPHWGLILDIQLQQCKKGQKDSPDSEKKKECKLFGLTYKKSIRKRSEKATVQTQDLLLATTLGTVDKITSDKRKKKTVWNVHSEDTERIANVQH